MNRKDLIPKLGSGYAKKAFDETKWHLFARRCQRNPFMREMVLNRDLAHPCAWCNRAIEMKHSWNIHHIDYSHQCTFELITTEKTVSIHDKPRNYTGPDCRTCFWMEPDKFNACFERLKLVHYRCNHQIELERQKMKKKKA